MLEKYSNPNELEAELKKQIQSVRLIGQIPLSEEDIKFIDNYIITNLSGKFSDNIDKILKDTPSIVACYLVCKGIQNYNEGTYWNAVKEELGPIDIGQQRILGDFFLKFIQSNNLFNVYIPRARKYITPILLQGGIPKKMISSFFDQIVYPLYRNELVNPTDESEITYWLESRRKEFQKNPETSEIETQLNNLVDLIDAEEICLENYKKELAGLRIKPKQEEEFQNGLEKIKHLLESYRSAESEMQHLVQLRNGQLENFIKYYDSGYLERSTTITFENFRNEILNSIIEAIVKSGNHQDELIRTDAIELARFFYQANLEGKLKMTSEQVQKMKGVLQEI